MEDYNPRKKRRALIVFDDIVADMEFNKIFSPIVNELEENEEENSIFHFFSYYNLISKSLKLYNYIQHINLSWKSLTKENFNKEHLIIRLTLISKFHESL